MTAPDKIWIYADTDDEGESYLELITSGAEAPADVEYTRTDLAQAAVAAAYEAAAQVAVDRKGFGSDAALVHPYDKGYVAACDAIATAIRALATPDQIAALAAERVADQAEIELLLKNHNGMSAEITRLRAVIAKDAAQMIEDQHKMHKAVEAMTKAANAIDWWDKAVEADAEEAIEAVYATRVDLRAVISEIGGA